MADVLLVGADSALRGLLEEWLDPLGYRVTEAGEGADLVLVDVAHPHRGGHEELQRLAREHPRTPLLVLSSSFFPGVDCCGAAARSLGVAGVLPKPLTREELLDAVSRVTGGR